MSAPAVRPLAAPPRAPSPGVERVLRIRNLGATLGEGFRVTIRALDLPRGGFVLLDAPSGAGKSTALGLIAGAIAPAGLAGQRHEVDGREVDRCGTLPGPETIGFVLQTSALVPYLTLAENIALPLRIARRGPDPDWYRHLIGALGLASLGHRLPAEVSVGQRQRAAIARALLGRPRLLLLDEPVSALDPANVEQVERLIRLLADEARSAVVLASHVAARGAFHDVGRARHRVVESDGMVESLFEAEAAEEAAA